jgi:hypothetical protein
MFGFIKARRNKSKYSLERSLLLNGIEKTLKLADPTIDLSGRPRDHLLLNGGILIMNLVSDRALVQEQFGFQADIEEAPRWLRLLIGSIAVRGFIAFGGYHEEKVLISLLQENMVRVVFPELNQDLPKHVQRNIIDLMDQGMREYHSKCGDRDSDYRRAITGFVLSQKESAYNAVLDVRREIFEKLNQR